MPANVLTFKVQKDSDFYKKYFEAHEERKHFFKLAKAFFDKYDIESRYYHTQRLEVNFKDPAVRECFKEQLCVNPDNQGFYRFKKTSALNKEWMDTVTSHVDFKKLQQCDLWFLEVMMSGKYAMWHLEDEIYGLVEDKWQESLTPMGYMIPIKLSEYYAAMEMAEEAIKAKQGGSQNE